MKIWRCNCYDKDLGQIISWHGSRKSATAQLLNFQEERGGGPVGPEGIEEMDIPTDKKGLIEWLNAYFTTDNG